MDEEAAQKQKEMERRRASLTEREQGLIQNLQTQSDGAQALIVLRTRATREAAETLLNFGEDVHHLVWAQSTGIEAVVQLFVDQKEEDLTIVTGKKGKDKLSAVTSLTTDHDLETLITSSGVAAYARMLHMLRKAEDVKAQRAREKQLARVRAEEATARRGQGEGDPAEATRDGARGQSRPRPRVEAAKTGLYHSGTFRAVFTDTLMKTLRVV